MATTTNYGWETPDNTNLVRDGAEAIRDLGEAIDNTVYLNSELGSGLTLISTTTFSGAATLTVNNVFTSTFDNYSIILNGFKIASQAAGRMRLTIAGTPTSTNNYFTAIQSIGYNGVSFGVGVSAVNAWFIGEMTTDGRDLIFDIHRPALATFKSLSGVGGTGGGTYVGASLSTLTNAHDGFILFNDIASNISGTVKIYGYRNTV